MTGSDQGLHDPQLPARIAALCDGEPDVIAKMATISCEIFQSDARFDWVGFYRVTAPEMLKIGPYQGGHGCLTIPFSRGVCGACARTGDVQIVPDVEAFEGHIACSATTRSEIVLPVFGPDKALIGVFDIDSNLVDAFSERDGEILTEILSDAFSSAEIAEA